MLSRLTRPVALASVALCALAGLTACGDDGPDEKTASGFDAVEISGPVGELPEIEWKAALEPAEAEAEVIEKGDGPAIEEGDKILTNLAISNDFGRDISFDTYSAQALLLTAGSDAEPTQVVDLMTQLIGEHIEPGKTTVGTRIAVVADAKEQFDDLALNLAQLGIGNEDGFVVVADLEAVPLDEPTGKNRAAPSWAPKIVEKKGVPSALDTSGLAEPDPKSTKLRKALLVEGTGPVVEKGQQIVVNYVGQTYDGDEPFDNGFTRPDPTIFRIGEGDVIKGWDRGLVGVKVGSRVVLEVPPKLGYGKKGQGESIPKNATLYFVVDVLTAA